MSKPTIEQYQGSPILCLNPDARYKFSFGVAKAKMILDNLEALKAFVASDGKLCAPEAIEGSRITMSDLLSGKVP